MYDRLERHFDIGGLCPRGVGVSVPWCGQCGQLSSPLPPWLSNLVIYVRLCRHGPLLSLFIETAVVLSSRLHPRPFVE